MMDSVSERLMDNGSNGYDIIGSRRPERDVESRVAVIRSEV